MRKDIFIKQSENEHIHIQIGIGAHTLEQDNSNGIRCTIVDSIGNFIDSGSDSDSTKTILLQCLEC